MLLNLCRQKFHQDSTAYATAQGAPQTGRGLPGALLSAPRGPPPRQEVQPMKTQKYKVMRVYSLGSCREHAAAVRNPSCAAGRADVFGSSALNAVHFAELFQRLP